MSKRNRSGYHRTRRKTVDVDGEIVNLFFSFGRTRKNLLNVCLVSFAVPASLPSLGETAWDRDHDRDRSRERNRERGERERAARERSGENERERQQERESAIREREARDRERERDRDRDRPRDRERDRDRDVSVCVMEPPDPVFVSSSAALLALQRIKEASL